MIEQIGTDEPNDEQIAAYIEETLQQGRVVPGYGHAVLRLSLIHISEPTRPY